MPTSTFRIQTVTLEGFKAFAAPQSVDLSGGHLFVFGKNGQGKSSIVEGIRWCLFGLAERPDVEVRNVFYNSGDCKVELELTGPGGTWKMLRRLRPGTGRSDLLIQNPDGTLVQQSVIFPHIARLGPKEGTHIIFASQQSSTRRPQADITDFDKVLYSYLRIEDVPQLILRFTRLLEEKVHAESSLAKDITALEEKLTDELQDVQNRLEEISRIAPWPTGSVPTNADTDSKIRHFLEQNGGSLTRADGGPVTRDWLLREAERAIQSGVVASTSDLNLRRRSVQATIQQLTSAWELKCSLERTVDEAKKKLAPIKDSFISLTTKNTKEALAGC
jgi:hypothetical protein